MEFLLTLIIIFVIGFWLLFKFLPMLLAWYLKRKFNAGQSNFQNHNRHNTERGKEGDVTVTSYQEKEKIITKEVGEYVDYEEEKNTEK